jgi:hypothetical protein
MDELLGQCETSWKEIARHLDSLRRQIAVVGAQMQRSRSLAALKKPEDEPPLEPAPRVEDHAEDTRPQGLVQEYEASLREGHVRRDALRAEMAALRRRREAAFRRLPVPLARAYESLVDGGVLPAIATVADGVCSACGSAVPAPLNTDFAEGRVGVCSACDRLLRPESPPQTGQ